MFPYCFSTFKAIDAQIDINAMDTSIPMAFDIIAAYVTVELKFKTVGIPYSEQTDISLEVNLFFEPMFSV